MNEKKNGMVIFFDFTIMWLGFVSSLSKQGREIEREKEKERERQGEKRQVKIG